MLEKLFENLVKSWKKALLTHCSIRTTSVQSTGIFRILVRHLVCLHLLLFGQGHSSIIGGLNLDVIGVGSPG